MENSGCSSEAGWCVRKGAVGKLCGEEVVFLLRAPHLYCFLPILAEVVLAMGAM